MKKEYYKLFLLKYFQSLCSYLLIYNFILDVAIGAPYEDGNGVVYIYHGSHTGIHKKYVQVCEMIKNY